MLRLALYLIALGRFTEMREKTVDVVANTTVGSTRPAVPNTTPTPYLKHLHVLPRTAPQYAVEAFKPHTENAAHELCI